MLIRTSAARWVISIFCSVPSPFFCGLNIVTVAFRTLVCEKLLVEVLDLPSRLKTYADFMGAPRRGAKNSKTGRGVLWWNDRAVVAVFINPCTTDVGVVEVIPTHLRVRDRVAMIIKGQNDYVGLKMEE